MNVSAIKLGSIVIPNIPGFRDDIRNIIDRYTYYVKQRQAYSITLSDPESTRDSYLNYDQFYTADSIRKYIESAFDYGDGYEDGVLLFRDVDNHSDDWSDIKYRGRNRAPGFLHVVLSGKFTLVCGSTKLNLKVGDVFIMNPNKNHKVINSRVSKTRNKYHTNVTFTRTVPLMCYNKSIPEILKILKD